MIWCQAVALTETDLSAHFSIETETGVDSSPYLRSARESTGRVSLFDLRECPAKGVPKHFWRSFSMSLQNPFLAALVLSLIALIGPIGSLAASPTPPVSRHKNYIDNGEFSIGDFKTL